MKTKEILSFFNEKQKKMNDEEREEPVRANRVYQYVVFSALIVVAACGYYISTNKEVFVPLPITPNMPTDECRPISKNEMASLARDPHWNHVVKSMAWHIKENDLEGISAFHVGDPICFIMIKFDDGSIVEMFNTEIKGYSPNAIVARNEESFACPGVVRNMMRAEHVIVTYNCPRTQTEMRVQLSGRQSFALQHVNFYSLGKTICDLHAKNTDKGIQTLKKLVDGI